MLPPLIRSVRKAHQAEVTTLKNQLLKSHGRPPWYGENGRPIGEAFVVGIAGGSASGKTHVARQIVQNLGSIPTVIILSQDSFYKKHTPEELELAFQNLYDFDHPDSVDVPLFAACLADLKAWQQSNIPIYSFTEHQRLDETKYLYGASIIITEGILALHDQKLRDLYDLKIFVQCDSDIMLARRIKRDVAERGRSVEGVLDQYLRFVKPSFDNFVSPSAKYADIIVPGSNNNVAIELISTHIRRELTNRAREFRCKITNAIKPNPSTPDPSHIAVEQLPNLHIIPQTPQLKGIYTTLRDKTSERQEFIFNVDRLATYLIEKALEFVPAGHETVTTPVGVEYNGRSIDTEICGVTILRSGGPLEKGMRRVLRDPAVGSLLIQSDVKSGEAILLHSMLPTSIRERCRAEVTWVFLLDAQIVTSASGIMAVRVLLDHGVQEDHIIFVTILAAPRGVHVLNRLFPKIKIVSGSADPNLTPIWIPGDGDDEAREVLCIEPGMGHIGDRYYL
ncbi:armadillo/beta-catenin/plakoglobin [Thelephora terrestris]|uniref:Uridine kinase n=1 Tax=Thelephora terrestris TaxID=56493 RepID=A0A9P6H5I2_9AGAM|nr:armadillo/beta-catenin/plakoglobin [Thelephora terrestris]